MKKIINSRGDQIDIQKLTESYGNNRYMMIQDLSNRAYELRRGAEPKITDHLDPFNSGVTTAILELQESRNV
jgi:hypothetical protein